MKVKRKGRNKIKRERSRKGGGRACTMGMGGTKKVQKVGDDEEEKVKEEETGQ